MSTLCFRLRRVIFLIVSLILSAVVSRTEAAVHTWTGNGANALWSNAANWTGGKPASGESGGTKLAFGTNTTSTCDIAGLTVDQIRFTGGGNAINGTTPLTISGLVVRDNIVSDSGTNVMAASLPLVYSGAACYFVVTAGQLTLAGNASGTVGMRKLGAATLTVTGLNSYAGNTLVSAGTLSLNSAGSNNAVPGSLIITPDLGTDAPMVVLQRSSEISDSATVTVYEKGTFKLNGYTETVGALIVSGSVIVSPSTSGKLLVSGNTTVNKGTISIGSADMVQLGPLTMPGGGITAADDGLLTLAGDVTATASDVDGAYITSPIAMNGTRTFTVNGSAAPAGLTVEGVVSEIAPGAGLTKSGTGTLKLLGHASNTYTGTTTVNSGLVQLNTNSGRLINGPLVIGNNADPAGSAIVQELEINDIRDTSVVTINASGVLDLNDHSDTVASLSGTGALLLPLNSTLTIAGAPATVFSGSVSGSGTLIRTGDGTLTLTGTMESAAHVRVNNGTIQYNLAPGSPRPASITVGDGSGLATSAILRLGANNLLPVTAGSLVTVNSDGRLDINNTAASVKSLTVYGGSVVLGTGQLTTLDTLTMSGGNIGSTSPGLLTLGGNINVVFPGVSGPWISGDIALNVSPVITVAGGTAPELTISGYVRNGASGPRGFTKSGPGTLRCSGSKANSFTEPVIVEKGTLEMNNVAGPTVPVSLVIGNDLDPAGSAVVKNLAHNNIAPEASVAIKASGLLNLNGYNERCDTLSGSGSVNLGSGRLTGGAGNGTSSFNGVVSGTGGLTKAGVGTLTLTNNNPYSGATQVLGGRLIVNGAQPASSVTVAPAGSLGGIGTAGAVTSNAAGAVVQPGTVALGTLAVTGNVNLAGGTFAARLNDTANPKKDQLLVSGNLNVAGASLAPLVAGPVTGFPYVIASYGTLTGTFGATPGCSVNYSYNDGSSSNHIAITITNPWIAWLSGYGLDPATTGASGADPDKDGVPNGVEFVLGTDPTRPSAPADLPFSTVEGANLVFTFRRSGAAAYLNPVAQISTSPAAGTWTDVSTGVSTNTSFYGPGIDRVTVTIPRNSNAHMFCRLKVVIP